MNKYQRTYREIIIRNRKERRLQMLTKVATLPIKMWAPLFQKSAQFSVLKLGKVSSY